MGELMDVIGKLDKDLKESVKTLSVEEARVLVEYYYLVQDYRIRAAHQAGQLGKAEKQHAAVEWLADQNHKLEDRVKMMLDWWTDNQRMGIWAKGICGVGPVIAAGLLAYIDIEQAPTVGHIWSYAGLSPTNQRKKGEKLKYNPELKVLCFKIGESFVKQQGRKSDIYGKLFAQRRLFEQMQTDAGMHAEQAATALTTKNFKNDTDTKKTYQSGKLPPAHLHARARRWVVKLFLAHWWEEAYRQHFGKEPPLPYPMGILGHAHRIEGPPPAANSGESTSQAERGKKKKGAVLG